MKIMQLRPRLPLRVARVLVFEGHKGINDVAEKRCVVMLYDGWQPGRRTRLKCAMNTNHHVARSNHEAECSVARFER